MKKLLLSLTLCSLFMSTPQQAAGSDSPAPYNTIFPISLVVGGLAGAGTIYCIYKKGQLAGELAMLLEDEEKLNPVEKQLLANELESRIYRCNAGAWIGGAVTLASICTAIYSKVRVNDWHHARKVDAERQRFNQKLQKQEEESKQQQEEESKQRKEKSEREQAEQREQHEKERQDRKKKNFRCILKHDLSMLKQAGFTMCRIRRQKEEIEMLEKRINSGYIPMRKPFIYGGQSDRKQERAKLDAQDDNEELRKRYHIKEYDEERGRLTQAGVEVLQQEINEKIKQVTYEQEKINLESLHRRIQEYEEMEGEVPDDHENRKLKRAIKEFYEDHTELLGKK